MMVSTASTRSVTCPAIRSRSAGSVSESTSSSSAVIGVRSRCERSATSSRSSASRSATWSPSSLSTAPTDATSAGPDGVTRALRSPAPSRSATPARSRTDRDSRAAIRSPASAVPPSSTRPTTASTAHARATPSVSWAVDTAVRTTVTPLVPLTGTSTSAPVGVLAVSAVPIAASSTDAVRSAGAPSIRPSGRKAVVSRSPVFTASSSARSRDASSGEPGEHRDRLRVLTRHAQGALLGERPGEQPERHEEGDQHDRGHGQAVADQQPSHVGGTSLTPTPRTRCR